MQFAFFGSMAFGCWALKSNLNIIAITIRQSYLFTPLYPDTHNNPSAASTAYSDLASHAADPPKDHLSDTLCSTRLPAHLLALDRVWAVHTRPVHPYQPAAPPASSAPPPYPTASVQKTYTAAAYHTRPAWAVNVYT
jgi:hypothetical protein